MQTDRETTDIWTDRDRQMDRRAKVNMQEKG